MRIMIPIGNTGIRICDLEKQISELKARGYLDYDFVEVKSYLALHFEKAKNWVTFAFTAPDIKEKTCKPQNY